MRELTLEELELVAGGTVTDNYGGDIVVTAPGDGGGDGGWGGGDFGDFGDYGDYGDTGGGGGGGGDTGTSGPVDVDVNVDPNTKQADIVVTASNSAGSFSADFNVNSFDLQSLTMTVNTDYGVYTGSVTLSTGMVDQSYQMDFGNNVTGTLSFGTNGTDYSVGASLSVTF